jgi:hypothetical protein
MDKVELPRPMIMCCLGYKLGDVDISKPMRRSARKAMKKQRITDTENYAEEVVETSDFNNMKFVEPIWRYVKCPFPSKNQSGTPLYKICMMFSVSLSIVEPL